MATELNSSMRREASRLIDEKANHVIEALTKEVSTNADLIRMRILQDAGHPMDSYELRAKIKELERQKKDAESEIGDDEVLSALDEESEQITESIDAEIEALRSQLDAQIMQLRNAFESQRSEIRSSREARVRDIDTRKKAREIELFEEKAPGLLPELARLNAELSAVRKLETDLATEVSRRANAIQSSRGRLIFLVNDAVSRAKINLMKCTTLEEAAALMDQIPTVAEVISIAEDPEQGLRVLVNRLAPSHQLQIEPPRPHEEEPTERQEPLPNIVVQRTVEPADINIVE